MNPLFYHESELKDLQKKLREINSQRRSLVDRIKNKVEFINNLKNPPLPLSKSNNYIQRDIDLCYDFIKKNPGIDSKMIIEHLNIVLEGKHTRWSNKLDSNTFMTRMGNNLKESNLFVFDKMNINGRLTTIWKIK